MKRFLKRGSFLVTLVIAAAGCSQGSNSSGEASSEAGVAAVASSYRLTSEPTGAQDVKAARSVVKDGENVVVVGRIGGDRNPWIEGMAAFTIVDLALKPCEDGCGTPWDYCCDLADLPASKVVVKIVDDQGRAVQTDSRKLLGVKEMQTVVTRGKAKRDEAGNLTVLASGVFVTP
ncbi:MAG: hypothetical protein ACYC4N_22015 [Pirellulaceae bacterium]